MPKTALDVATRALRIIGVTGVSATSAASDHAYALEAAEGALALLQDQHEIPATWLIDATPDAVFLPFADLVAAELATQGYGSEAPSRTRAIMQIRASYHPDDRVDSRDLDGDGLVSDDEAAAALRSQYY